MATLNEGRHTGEFIGQQAMGDAYHNKPVTLLSGQDLSAGTVLGKVTASGKYKILDPASANGDQNAAAILYDNEDATAGDLTVVVVIRGPMTVNYNDLVWPAGITANQKAAAIVQLEALGIVPSAAS